MKSISKIKIFGLVLGISLLGIATVNGQGGVSFIKDKPWEEVLKLAAAEDKLIFMDAYTTWCGPCKKMDRQVFPLESVGNFYNDKFISVKMDMEKGEGRMLAKRYNVRAYPTFLFIDSEGNLLHRSAGYIAEKDMIKLGEMAADPTQQLVSMMNTYQKGERSPEFLYKYAYARFKAADKSHGKIAKEYLATQEDWATEKNRQFIFDFVDDTDSKAFEYLVKNRVDFDNQFSKAKTTGIIQNLSSAKVSDLLAKKGDESVFEEAERLYNLINPERAASLMENFKMQYYRANGDRVNYAKSAVNYINVTPAASPDQLNEIAWTFFRVIDDKAQLTNALGWVNRAIKAEKKVYYFHDTKASLLYKLGEYKKAKKSAKKAIKLGIKDGEDVKSIEELMVTIQRNLK